MQEGDVRTSECPYGAYYPAAEGSLPAAVGEQAEPGQLPVAVLGVVREDAPRGVAGRSAREVQDAVVVLGHCPLILRERTGCASHPGNSRRRRETVAGNRMGGLSGFTKVTDYGAGTGISWPRRVWYLRRSSHWDVAGSRPVRDGPWRGCEVRKERASKKQGSQ